jgi:hypothetical protein
MKQKYPALAKVLAQASIEIDGKPYSLEQLNAMDEIEVRGVFVCLLGNPQVKSAPHAT